MSWTEALDKWSSEFAIWRIFLHLEYALLELKVLARQSLNDVKFVALKLSRMPQEISYILQSAALSKLFSFKIINFCHKKMTDQ